MGWLEKVNLAAKEEIVCACNGGEERELRLGWNFFLNDWVHQFNYITDYMFNLFSQMIMLRTQV
jgi:hypothetical protein